MSSQEEAAIAAAESIGSKLRMPQLQEEAILKELREISDRHSAHYNKYQGDTFVKRPRIVVTSSSLMGAGISQENAFLSQIDEDRDLNQYWYSEKSIEILCDAIREGLSLFKGKRVAFLSTPSLFFSLSMEEREHCALFEVSCLIDFPLPCLPGFIPSSSFLRKFDTSWESCPGYHFYDYKHPTDIEDSCRGAFDLVVIDPPFISQSVWRNYATTASLLSKGGEARVIATTVSENSALMESLFGCRRVSFRPMIPHLVYQYSAFANFPTSALDNNENSELRGEESSTAPVK